MSRKNTQFDIRWIKTLEAEKWLKKGTTSTTGYCGLCCSSIDVATSGVKAIKQHMKSKKHLVRFKNITILYYRMYL